MEQQQDAPESLSTHYGNALIEVGHCLLYEYLPSLNESPKTLAMFLQQIQNLYRDNPYHNQLHAAMVGHSTICFTRYLGLWNKETGLTTDLDYVSVVVAALSHDVGHPGRNNMFFINANDLLAVLYNDAAVLENFHSCLTFKVLNSNCCRLFRHLSLEEFRAVRKNIIGMILATDMSQHFEHVARFRIRRASPEFDYNVNVEDMWMIMKLCIKLGDLGHTMVDWDLHLKWSLRLAEEFYQQGDEEFSLGLPKSPLCDRFQHSEFAKSQKGFIEFVVQPFLKELEFLNEPVVRAELTDRLNSNKRKWEELAEKKEPLEIPEEYKEYKTSVDYLPVLLVKSFLSYFNIQYSDIVFPSSTQNQYHMNHSRSLPLHQFPSSFGDQNSESSVDYDSEWEDRRHYDDMGDHSINEFRMLSNETKRHNNECHRGTQSFYSLNGSSKRRSFFCGSSVTTSVWEYRSFPSSASIT